MADIDGAALESLRVDARARLEVLVAKGWSLPGGHALAGLQGRSLGEHRLIVLLGPKNNVGSRYFQLFLADAEGGLAGDALALGMHNTGPYPAFNWVELTQYRSQLAFGNDAVDLEQGGLDLQLFEMLGALVPRGGHIMVEYDSPTQKSSERVLTLGYPQATSPLGYLMFRVGCRSFRDWYISEGGREGPRKLQGFKPLNAEIAREKTAALRSELESLVTQADSPAHGEWGVLARRNAQQILQELKSAN